MPLCYGQRDWNCVIVVSATLVLCTWQAWFDTG